jgi:hypothetical protein
MQHGNMLLKPAKKRGHVPMADPSQCFSNKPEKKEQLILKYPRSCQFSTDFQQNITAILYGTSFVHIGVCPGPGQEDSFESVAAMVVTRDGRFIPNIGAVIADNWNCRFPSDWVRIWWELSDRSDDSAIWDGWRDLIRDYRLYFSNLQDI